MNLNLSRKSKTPLYLQVYRSLKQKILKNDLKENTRLPAVRTLADENSLNPSTVVKAYEKLKEEKLIYKKVGSGSYVSSAKEIKINEDYDDYVNDKIDSTQMNVKNNINFASATPSHDLFPVEDFKNAINQVLDRDGGKAFDYQNTQGYIPLRKHISDFLKSKNIVSSFNDIQIVSGAQQAIDIISKIFINEGDNIAIENPSYSGALASFKERKAKIHNFNITQNGIDLDGLEKFLQKNKINFLYCMPNFQNPTGVIMSLEDKKRLIDMSVKYDFFIVEDDCISELNYFNEDVTSLKSLDNNNKVIYIKSYSKIFMPGLRLGFMIFPKSLSAKIISTKYSSDISTSGLNQRAFDLYLKNGDYEKHIYKINLLFKKRFIQTKKIIERYSDYFEMIFMPKGGVYFWLRLKNNNFDNFIYKCRTNGVSLLPEKYFNIENKNVNKFFRLSFSDTSLEQINKGFEIMKNIIDDDFSEENIQPIV
jgi:DNA-binding transcriptional MocR family regulator